MIGHLHGSVILRDAKTGLVIVDVAGVGYQVLVSMQALAEVPEPGNVCTLWVHTHVREDALELFGFASAHERRMFLLLLSVPQVGPRLALVVLGGFPLGDLIAAIAGGERSTLEKIPGVGRKTAERILIDLKEKVLALADAVRRPVETSRAHDAAGLADEARSVLVNLGWKLKAVDVVLPELLESGEALELDELVRRALARLMER